MIAIGGKIRNADNDCCTSPMDLVSREDSLHFNQEGKDQDHRSANTYTQAMLRIPARAIFVWRFICRFHTRTMGNKPRVKSQSMATTL